MAFLGVVFLVMNVESFARSWLLNHTGVTTHAAVSATHSYHRRGGAYFQADYAFDVGNRHLTNTGDISASTYYSLRPGDGLPILYVPSIPGISETVEMSHYASTLFITAFIGFPASLFILFVAFNPKKPSGSVEELLPIDVPGEPAHSPAVPLPPTVTGMAFTVYPVSDMARARQFYETVLGLRPAREINGDWVEYHLWESCFALKTILDKQANSLIARVAFEVTNLDGFVNDLRAHGTPITVEPFSTSLCRTAVILDTEGNALTLHSRYLDKDHL